MDKFEKVLIITGNAGVGKDTFVNMLNKHIGAAHISIVDHVKDIARRIGWNGEKGEKDREFLSDLKLLIDEYNNANLKYVIDEISLYYAHACYGQPFLCIDMREKKDIDAVIGYFGHDKIQIVRVVNNRVLPVTSNIADKNVEENDYDYLIENNGTKEDLERTVAEFIDQIMSDNI